ncbi:hypothetical protein ACLGI4_14085 [Streptomyces sp. HMX112]|uniref:hypothetical protein n=1 Tax=Streptomyces sp. HMX112 TaxID=3390850 RepID=UPI003A80AFCE
MPVPVLGGRAVAAPEGLPGRTPDGGPLLLPGFGEPLSCAYATTAAYALDATSSRKDASAIAHREPSPGVTEDPLPY